ncbi:uncharacterized protein LOC120350820 [Nilaparvata lugens]|uniref:uncharacterized protein LOC120350820 n=1 Tax=Nilaparvata lugens TaxID=108931 RepID=UPI00193DA08E|nr:uncharacterized protein LOC120350820 [Nilaparvata lugens]
MELHELSETTTGTTTASTMTAAPSSTAHSSSSEDDDEGELAKPLNDNVQFHDVKDAKSTIYVKTTQYDEGDSVLRASAVTYLSGVVIHYVQKKFDCAVCAKYMCKENTVLERSDELFVYFKAYDSKIATDFGGLKVPSEEFRSVIDICLTILSN